MEIQKIINIIGGFILIISAFLHVLFVFGDPKGAILYYWILRDPGEYHGIETIAAVGVALMFALVFSVVHAVIYFIMGGFLLGFKNNRIVPSFSTILTIVGIILASRVIFIFGYISNNIIIFIIIDIIVLTMSIYIFVSLSM